jgi:heparin/heparan-sulfate lyase
VKKAAFVLVAAGLGAAIARAPEAAPAGITHPRLLVAERDPFSGLPALRARWAAGERPSDDLPGWALSYLLSGDESYARRAVEALARPRPRQQRGSNRYIETLNDALAFDWLYGYTGFDDAMKDRLARELVDAAETELANPLLADPEAVSYHNHFVRYLTRAAVALYAVEGERSVEARAAPMRERVRRALDNVLDSSDFVTPDGGYHESMDYMRITFAPLALLAEMRRTMGDDDPARRHPVFSHMGGDTYLYKVEPDGTTSRDDDDEWPHLQALDNVVLGYAIHRFKDPFAAWIQRESGWLPKEWTIPVLQFLWSDATVGPRDPRTTTDAELPRAKLFRGIGHFVMRDGWGPDSTWIEFDAGPFFAKHDHLDQGHFVIHHKGDLAIDSGMDYTDTESPHYLNYYRRTVAHNSMLVYEPGETFFWGENLLPAANDGGQRMDSSRYWNTIRSREDFRRTRDLWDLGRMEAAVHAPGGYDYARGDITRAYHASKMERFTRELVYTPGDNVLVVYDRVRATDPAFRKAWLLHGVNEPKVEGSVFTFEERKGRLRVHSLLPAEREIRARGGPGQEFWTPGDEKGGAWGSGRNWPPPPFEGGPLPDAPDLRHMWKTFWGEDLERLSPSNARNVVPGAWRIEVSPDAPAKEDHFLHVLEIGDAGDTRARRVERVQGHRLEGALVEGGLLALFDAADDPLAEGEVTLPDVGAKTLLLTRLVPGARYELQLTPNSNPGAPMWRQVVESDESGLAHLAWDGHRNARLRLRRIQEERP